MLFYFPNMCFFIKTTNEAMIEQILKMKQGICVKSVGHVFNEAVAAKVEFLAPTQPDGVLRNVVDYEWAEVVDIADRRQVVAGFVGRGVSLIRNVKKVHKGG